MRRWHDTGNWFSTCANQSAPLQFLGHVQLQHLHAFFSTLQSTIAAATTLPYDPSMRYWALLHFFRNTSTKTITSAPLAQDVLPGPLDGHTLKTCGKPATQTAT